MPAIDHETPLVLLTLLVRLLAVLLLFLSSSLLPLFDTSPRLISLAKWAQPLLRWDAFHFAHIAHHNAYLYEYEWAFLPGTPFLMRHAASFVRLFIDGEVSALLLGGTLLSMAIACDSTRTLYRLSLLHLKSQKLAYLTGLLSLLPSSPPTLYLAPYSEPFFTYLSYRGMLYCARQRWLAASLAFALASTFRSNGILLSGFVVWGLVVQPFLDTNKLFLRSTVYAILLTLLISVPFILHNYAAYHLFCSPLLSQSPQWCRALLPSIYTHVQSRYWNVGFLRYWTLAQLPNILIAAPPLILLSTFSLSHLSAAFLSRPSLSKWFTRNLVRQHSTPNPFHTSALTPHALYALFTIVLFLTNAHTQITLRLVAALPATYWAAAALWLTYPPAARAWAAWSALWGAAAVVLWAAFLPPA